MHACDRQTDGQTDRRTDRITTPKTALAYAHAVKTITITVIAIIIVSLKEAQQLSANLMYKEGKLRTDGTLGSVFDTDSTIQHI